MSEYGDDKTSTAEPSAKEQLEGNLGDLDKLVILMQALKTMIPPSPSAGPLAGPPSPGIGGPGGMPMGSSPMGGLPMMSPPPMRMPPSPGMPPIQQAPQQALDQSINSMRGLM